MRQDMLLMLAPIILLSALSSTLSAAVGGVTPIISKPGCPSKCGNLTVPYPFGIGPGCALNKWFQLNCINPASGPPLALLDGISPDGLPGNRALQLLAISDDGRVRVSASVLMSNCYDTTGQINNTGMWFTGLMDSPYSYSDLNKVTVLGCEDNGYLIGSGSVVNLDSSCDVSCARAADMASGSCGGIGCCERVLLKGQSFYIPGLRSYTNHSDILSFNPCSYMFIGEEDRFVFRGASDLSDPDLLERIRATVPTVLDWRIGNLSCTELKNSGDYMCRENSHCVDSDAGLRGYRCSCDDGYQGNPYLDPGCIDINECLDPNLNDCEKSCTNTIGSFNCSCPHGQYGNGRKSGKGCIDGSPKFPIIKVVLGAVLGLLSLAMAATCLHYLIKKRKLLNQRTKFFERNGGLLLQQQLSSKGNPGTESTKIFTADELQQATNNYADDRILGKGGFGTVYKGILPDKSVVAIKKSREIDEAQIEQFIHEVLVLTQIKHRNVVKYLGCCLESEVPLLVFEYIPNETLSQHIQRKSTWLSWEDRLRVASEAADALSYLHSSASTPIIHRDVKSANILLDECYTAKVSDFGASRLIPLDQTRVTTMVIGTMGYLDPEYFRTSQLTDKSDVYSFGVVLVELMTGGIPVDMRLSEERRSLTVNFMNSVKENKLFEALEGRVAREGSFEQLQAAAELAGRCLQSSPEERPTMREVAAELEMMRKNLGSVDGEEAAVSLEGADLYSAPISPYDSTTQEFTGLYCWSSSTTSEV